MSAADPTDDEVAQQLCLRQQCLKNHVQECHRCWDWICCDCTCEERPEYAKDCGRMKLAMEDAPQRGVMSLFRKIAKCTNCNLKTCRDWREIEVMEGAE